MAYTKAEMLCTATDDSNCFLRGLYAGLMAAWPTVGTNEGHDLIKSFPERGFEGGREILLELSLLELDAPLEKRRFPRSQVQQVCGG